MFDVVPIVGWLGVWIGFALFRCRQPVDPLLCFKSPYRGKLEDVGYIAQLTYNETPLLRVGAGMVGGAFRPVTINKLV